MCLQNRFDEIIVGANCAYKINLMKFKLDQTDLPDNWMKLELEQFEYTRKI